MNVKIVSISALVLWGLTLAIWGLWNKSSPDAREPIHLPAMARAKVLAEMRGMLESLRDIQNALPAAGQAPESYTAMAQAAHRSGTTLMVDDGPLMKMMPPDMVAHGLKVHQGFDQVEAMALAKAPLARIQKQVGDILNTCVACHAQFRLP